MRKKKKISHNLPNFQVEEDVSFVIEAEPEPLEMGSACSFSLDYDNRGIPLIRVKTYGDVDLTKLREMILKRYPEAKLKILEMPTIEVHKPAKPRRKKRKQQVKRKNKRIKKSKS